MNKKLTACIIALFILVIINKAAYSLNTYQKTQFSEDYQGVSETIVALNITRKKYQKLLLVQKASPKNKIIIKEYSIFIDFLTFQINNYCTKLIKEYGEESVQDLPCSSNHHLEANTNDSYQTADEKIESLDDEFMTALGEFDEMLLIEDEKIAQINQNKANRGSGSSNGKEMLSGNGTGEDADSNRDDNKEAGKEKNATSKANNKNTTSQKSRSQGQGKNKQTKNKSYMRDKLDQIDDDIVARQLKEAAEKETNPELKEKLWDEYYKYKQTIGK
ncbi:MAG: hypothetical protein KZQ70_01105 [gamma proteobacterium symbiont of Lucinoma myriamae]|nr:hypothetical protein [gamma proteobacterium symbiont of Lucinoma myriamae]MCU7818233.1 hypothetical protein [gamma proteobacterium symbiont of Lucinoma myriamae]